MCLENGNVLIRPQLGIWLISWNKPFDIYFAVTKKESLKPSKCASKEKNSCCFFIVKRYLVCTFVSCPNWHFSTWVKPYIPLGQIQRRTWDFCTFGRTIVCLENSCLVQYTYIVLLYNGLGSIIRSPFTQLEQALYPKF